MKKYCPICCKEQETNIKKIKETYPVLGKPITIIANVRFCNVCGCDLWDEKLDSENLIHAYEEYENTYHKNILKRKE